MADKKPPKRSEEDFDNIRPRDEEVAPEEEKYTRRDRRYDRYDDQYNNRYPYRTSTSWIWPILLFLIILLLFWWLFTGGRVGNITNINQNQQNQKNQPTQEFKSPQNTSSFQSSIPAQAETVAAPPASILIQTSTPISQNSTININLNNQDYGMGNTTISSTGTTLQRTMDQNSPDGIYTVNYKTCTPNGDCQSGSFQFKIDRSNTQGFDDERNKNSVHISYQNGKFYPENMLISKGTKVTWSNNNAQSFVIQSGTVGTNNYFVSLKSNTVSPNMTFSYTFGQTGYYPYFATVDGNNVSGKIIVQ